jgi:hypothetical protein
MNERLQNLAREAGHFEFNKWDYFDINKFAELIVKESMAMCDELQAQYLTSRKSTMDFGEKNIYAEGEAACDIIKYKMKKQFGVE